MSLNETIIIIIQIEMGYNPNYSVGTSDSVIQELACDL